MTQRDTRTADWLSTLVLVAVVVLATTSTALAMAPSGTASPQATGSGGAGTPPAFASDAESCSNVVEHDAFRFNNETISAAANGSATSISQNTKVTVEQNTGFVRVNAENPNAYCVRFHVEISEQIVSPAEIGPVTATDSDLTAEWHAVRDFDAQETYTQVTFTLPAASTATFAPSKIRIESLAWTSKAEKAKGFFTDIKEEVFGDPALEKHTYKITVTDNSSVPQQMVTVPLSNSSTGRQVNEWQASYKTEDGYWKPISKDSEAPVFVRRLDDERLQFIFNDPNATVKFVANPGPLDKLDYQIESYQAGFRAIQQQVLEFIG